MINPLDVVDSAKNLAKLVQELGKVELYQKVVELQGDIVRLSGENLGLRGEVKELKGKLKIKSALHFQDNRYWVQEGERREGPFCTPCQDDKQKLVRLHRTADGRFHVCPACRTLAH